MIKSTPSEIPWIPPPPCISSLFKYSDTWAPCHTSPKTFTCPLYYLLFVCVCVCVCICVCVCVCVHFITSCFCVFFFSFLSLNIAGWVDPITKTCLYNFDPLKPHFYIVKLGFTGVYIIFLISAQNIHCGYSLEPPRRGGSNEFPQSMFWAEIWKISEFFLSEKFQSLEVKFSIYIWIGVFS